MADAAGSTRVRKDGRIVFLSVGVYLVTILLSGATYLLVRSVGWETVGLALGGVVGLGVLLWLYDRARSTVYEFRASELVRTRDPVIGVERTAVPYDDVAFATRDASDRQSWLGVASFELVRADGENLELSSVESPDAVEAALRQRLPTPAEWLADRDEADTALHATVEELHHRRDDRRPLGSAPDEAGDDETRSADGAAVVVTRGELTDVVGVDADSIDLDDLADAEGVDDVSDVNASDVGHGDQDAGDFDGGDP